MALVGRSGGPRVNSSIRQLARDCLVTSFRSTRQSHCGAQTSTESLGTPHSAVCSSRLPDQVLSQVLLERFSSGSLLQGRASEKRPESQGHHHFRPSERFLLRKSPGSCPLPGMWASHALSFSLPLCHLQRPFENSSLLKTRKCLVLQ